MCEIYNAADCQAHLGETARGAKEQGKSEGSALQLLKAQQSQAPLQPVPNKLRRGGKS